MIPSTTHDWALAPFKMWSDRIPDDIDPKLAERIARGSSGKFSMAFGQLYGTPGEDVKLGKRWKCARCQKVHYSEEEPSRIPMGEVRIKEGNGVWSMPMVPCRYSYMPVFEVQPYGTCDEEMVKWVMGS